MAGRDGNQRYGRLAIGKVIAGRYTISKVIGEGAQSVVYGAHRRAEPGQRQPEEVALKVIHRHLSGNEQIKKRFHREAAILRRLDGEHIVKLLDFIEEDGLLMIALENVESESLEARLGDGTPLSIDDAVEITLQIAAALGAAHAAGVIHRDLKPANVLLERTGGDEIRVKVVDFGLARVVLGNSGGPGAGSGSGSGTTNLTDQGMIFGTPEYMAPEQARGDETDARSDLYAAGIMLYEMAVGEVPFPGRSALAAMTAHLNEAPPSPRVAQPLAKITPALEAVILRALEKDPARRYESARAFAEAIAGARDATRVIAPHAVSNPEQMATRDTDLHLAPPSASTSTSMSMGTARTLPDYRTEGGAEELRKADDAGRTKRSRVVQASVPVESDSAEIEVRLPMESRWIWIGLAIVAAGICVAIGIVVGGR